MVSQKHIVITVMGSLGDLHPMIAIGAALKARGHRVTIAAASSYKDRIEQAGLVFYSLRPELEINDKALYREIFDLRHGAERLIRRYVLPTVQNTLNDLQPLLETADFLLNATLILPGPLLARKLNLPWASIALQPFGYFSAYDPSVLPFAPWMERACHFGPGFWRVLIQIMHWGSAPWFGRFNRLRKSLEVTDYGHPLLEGQFSPWLNLALFSPVFASPQKDWPEKTIAMGFPFQDALSTNRMDLPEPVREFLNTGDAPIIFTLGSSAVHIADDFYDMAARTLKRLGGQHRAIFLVGDNLLNESINEQILIWDYLPYGHIFNHASLIVHQGGIGTTAQAMRAGKPTVIIPYGFDQPDNAARAERLGVSITIVKKKLNEATLSQALKKLLTDKIYQEKAASLSHTIRSEKCFEVACKSIEALL